MTTAVHRGGKSRLGRFIDQRETYGAHVLREMISAAGPISLAIDLGAGEGRDLELVREIHPTAHTVAVEGANHMVHYLRARGHRVELANLESDALPFASESVDLVVANQVLEHTKEIFWIFHEVTRCLRPGGRFVFGVPNVLSFHNRIGGLFGRHPTQHKLASAHVRPFSKDDTLAFLQACSPGTFELRQFAGSQFYPFPPLLARRMAKAFPNAAYSIFFSIEKVGPYTDQFVRFPSAFSLETSFYTGPVYDPRWAAPVAA